MASNRTLAIIKPDALARHLTGQIIALLESNGFELEGARIVRLTNREAGAFYAVHRDRPFYRSLVDFMISGPCMPMALNRADAVATLRRVIGATDPAEAAPGTVRKLFAESKERNAIHASDSDENASHELQFFFAGADLI